MPGLFGIISKTPGLTKDQLLKMAESMGAALRPTPWLKTEIRGNDFFCAGRVHLGVLNPDAQPLTSTDQQTVAWFDGEIYPSPKERGKTPDIQEIANLIDADHLAEMDGVFALAHFDLKKQELTLVNDRLGYRPLYYTQTNEWFAYASEVKALLAIVEKLPDIDDTSLRQFWGFSYILGERTWWKGIELIPPANIWKISANGIQHREYWSFDAIDRQLKPEKEVIDEFGLLWAQAVRQRIKPGLMPILLSGGLDSRLVLAEWLAQGITSSAINFGSKNSTDYQIALLCAQAAKIPFDFTELTEKNWWQGRENFIWQIDGHVNSHNHHVAIVKEKMHMGNCLSHMNLAGDTLFGGSKLHPEEPADWWHSPQRLLAKQYLPNPFFTEDEVSSISLEDTKRYVRGPSSDCFIFSQRQRRLILHGCIGLAPHCEIVFPGVSLPILKLLLGAVSEEQRANSKFYNRFLVSKYPKFFRNIPWQGSGRGLAEHLPLKIKRDFKSWLSLVRWGKTWPYNEIAPYHKFFRQNRILQKLLAEKLISDELMGGKIKNMLTNDPEQILKGETLGGILTLETYFRRVNKLPALDPDFLVSQKGDVCV